MRFKHSSEEGAHYFDFVQNKENHHDVMELEKAVYDWCEEQFGASVDNSRWYWAGRRGEFFFVFNDDYDAFHFKMRWL